MHDLYKLLADRVGSALKRQSLTTCSKWAEACRVMGSPFPGPWTFNYHPWLKSMHDSTAELNVGQKAAQMGFTETVLNIAFYHIDMERKDVLYVLPAKTPDASDFSAARFDPALELSPHLEKLFSDVKNIGHKRAGSANLYIRGSKSRSGLKSIPTALIILDEVDEMAEENIPLAIERTAGQLEKMIWAISTPTLPGVGINKMYNDTTREHFFFRCPHCNKLTELTFPECLVITADTPFDKKIKDSHYICKECKGRLEQKEKPSFLSGGQWVPENTQSDSRGFHIPQLYSYTRQPHELATSFLKSQYDPSEEQEFYNSRLGVPHVVSGAQITDADITERIGDYRKGRIAAKTRYVTVGIDVGKFLHYEIDEWFLGMMIGDDVNTDAMCRVIDFGKVEHFDELDPILKKHRFNFCIIDANPERRASLQFANRFYGYVKTCFYGQGISGKEIQENKNDPLTISVDRTSWLDLSLGRFKREKAITIPVDTDHEYKQHLKTLVRVYKKDRDGNPVGRYENGNKEDHYAHARNYAEIALPFAVKRVRAENIKSPL